MHHAATLPEITSLEQARGLLSNLSQLNQQLLWRVSQLEQALYGSTSERQTNGTYSKEQILLSLFGANQPASTENVVVEEKQIERPAKRVLAVKEITTVTKRLEPAEKVCAHCGKAKCEIGCEVSERYEYIPAKVVRHQIERPKLACGCGQSGVSIAPLPPQVIEQGQAGASLVAQVMLNKFDNHMPLYRQQQEFARLGLNFPRQTLAGWVERWNLVALNIKNEETPTTIAMLWDRTATTRLSTLPESLTRARWGILRPTVMDFMTWPGM